MLALNETGDVVYGIHEWTLKYSLCVLLIIALLGLAGCREPDRKANAQLAAVDFEPSDECHICGMVIANLPGPKGEALLADGRVFKFCSTYELFTWLLQPENRHLGSVVFVHDMSRTDWNTPGNEYLIDARTASYVLGAKIKSGMGPSLASFKSEEDAKAFMAVHGGHLLGYEQINLEVLNRGMEPMMTSENSHANQQ
ncbi:nitrous oxide reductase accessory protein NosL [Hahella aquimaris]|uniref:nitrous oxide reductase accessory protein NosL n=1 Tax=Hahella sp. HNIBRBA332 TaxID=3015983 RepID=UPI00273B204B|nr:nitrous oxide reductase accessory protein NosL [Hahella sp. HNIBRBA332]WLQ16314.1 nitrous oxide reductase accessory protein NosL [Hahella sp. HNIBRBA332]